MKKGRTDRTGIFGSDAEFYVSRLFMMMINLNSARRPDLVSINGRFNPKLSIEVKSGRGKKGVLNEGQLHYAISTWKDYENIFNEEAKIKEGFFSGKNLTFQKEKVAFYYNLIDRIDECTSYDVDLPFSSIKLKWGDQYIVPHEFAFYAFAVAKAVRTEKEKNIGRIIKELTQTMKEEALNEEDFNFEERRTSQSWQNLHGRDILAIFKKDYSLLTKKGEQRMSILEKVYPNMNNLERIILPAPNNNSIYILSKPEDYGLFDSQLRAIVEERIPVLEKISREREEAIPLIGGIEESENNFLIQPSENYKIITKEDALRLKRLSEWLAEGEYHVDLIPF